ncbi:MAG: hypothetical protein P8N71_08265 [Alphaproteobacteria bacterium]|jgi:hypothetical protein|nr:hypothetical protein [Alphaproteobacteria bacterium]
MAPKTYELNFEPALRCAVNKSILDAPGIYCVYACKPEQNDPEQKMTDCVIDRLLFIGTANDMRAEITNKLENENDWQTELGPGEDLCFSQAFITDIASPVTDPGDRKRAAAALIYRHQPLLNTEHRDGFAFDKTTIEASGIALYPPETFTVETTT